VSRLRTISSAHYPCQLPRLHTISSAKHQFLLSRLRTISSAEHTIPSLHRQFHPRPDSTSLERVSRLHRISSAKHDQTLHHWREYPGCTKSVQQNINSVAVHSVATQTISFQTRLYIVGERTRAAHEHLYTTAKPLIYELPSVSNWGVVRGFRYFIRSFS